MRHTYGPKGQTTIQVNIIHGKLLSLINNLKDKKNAEVGFSRKAKPFFN